MCIANVVGWLRYTTIYIITTVYTIAYTWIHTLAYVSYCYIIITTIVWVKVTQAVYYYYSVAYVVQNTIIVNYM